MHTIILTSMLAAIASGVPWTHGLSMLTASIEGPIPILIGGIAIVAFSAAYAFRHQFDDMLGAIAGKVLAIGGGVTAAAMMAVMFGVAGAVV